MRHMISVENYALLWTRPMSPNYEFSVLTTKKVIDQCVVGNKSAGGGQSYLAPLYLDPSLSKLKGIKNIFSGHYELTKDNGGKIPNLSPQFIQDFSQRLGLAFIPEGRGDLSATLGPEDVFYYSYAVFHSPTYRRRYAEFLKVDFPRLPLTGDKSLFAALAAKGAELVKLHLLESPRLAIPITRFEVSGSKCGGEGAV